MSTENYEITAENITKAGLPKSVFEVIVSTKDRCLGSWQKPSPAVYQEVVRRLGLKSHQCTALEDSKNGVEAAHAAGLSVVYMPHELTESAELTIPTKICHEASVDNLRRLLGLPSASNEVFKTEAKKDTMSRRVS